jgi:hypothetical protein
MEKTIIKLTKANGEICQVKLNYDDATIEAISAAAIELIHLNYMAEGDTLTVSDSEE